MRSLTPPAVFVVAILALVSRGSADEPRVPGDETTANTTTAVSATNPTRLASGHPDHIHPPHGMPPQFESHSVHPDQINGFDQYRQTADIGSPASPGYGFKHFPSPMHAFTRWHRPRAATLTAWQRCAPQQFRPRGYGDLFARPCDPFRMDYTPHTLHDGHSKYGPAYLLRAPDQRCEKCDHH